MKHSCRIHDVGDSDRRVLPQRLNRCPYNWRADRAACAVKSSQRVLYVRHLIDWLDGRRNNVVVRIIQVTLRDGVKACLVKPQHRDIATIHE